MQIELSSSGDRIVIRAGGTSTEGYRCRSVEEATELARALGWLEDGCMIVEKGKGKFEVSKAAAKPEPEPAKAAAK